MRSKVARDHAGLPVIVGMKVQLFDEGRRYTWTVCSISMCTNAYPEFFLKRGSSYRTTFTRNISVYICGHETKKGH